MDGIKKMTLSLKITENEDYKEVEVKLNNNRLSEVFSFSNEATESYIINFVKDFIETNYIVSITEVEII